MSRYTNERQRAYCDMVLEKYFKKYKEIFGNGETARVIARSINAGSTNSENVDAIIKLFIVIFKGKGFSREEAINFLNNNKRIFELPYSQVLTVLSLTETAGLSEQAVFERPGFIVRAHDLKKLYNSIRVCRNESKNPTLDRILELENESNREIEFKYEKSRIDMYRSLYKAKLMRNLKEQEETQSGTLKRTEE